MAQWSRRKWRVPPSRHVAEELPSLPSKNEETMRLELESLKKRVASLKKTKKNTEENDEDSGSDHDERALSHRRAVRSTKRSTRGPCFTLLCCGCEPGCLRTNSSSVCSCCCDTIDVCVRVFLWACVVFVVLYFVVKAVV